MAANRLYKDYRNRDVAGEGTRNGVNRGVSSERERRYAPGNSRPVIVPHPPPVQRYNKHGIPIMPENSDEQKKYCTHCDEETLQRPANRGDYLKCLKCGRYRRMPRKDKESVVATL